MLNLTIAKEKEKLIFSNLCNEQWLDIRYFQKLARHTSISPLSALLFVLPVEILALRIRNNKDIKGFQIKIDEQTPSVKLLQLADDTTLYFNSKSDIF